MSLNYRYHLGFLMLATVLTISAATQSPAPKSEIGSKKILVLLPLAAPSHHNIFSALTSELLDRGHQITIVSARPQKRKHPQLREIFINDPFEKFLNNIAKEFFTGEHNLLQTLVMMANVGTMFNGAILGSSEAVALKNEKFDLVITEAFFFQEPLLAFAHHFGCPNMILNPVGYTFHLNEYTGGAANPAYVPSVFSSGTKLDTFLDRLKNVVSTTLWKLVYRFHHLRRADALMRTVFPDAPSLEDLLKNISLTLINNNNALMHPVPLAPSVIEVGGIHIKPGKPLPADLKKWIEDSKDGIVYFSLGSNLRADLLPEDKRNMMFESFRKLKQRVLFKWNGDIPANAPANCRFEEWVPQQEVLAHPKLKVFVTHGGLLSTQESVYFGAPIIGMPVFGDQFMNMETARKKGFAVQVSIVDLSTEMLDAALNEIINNPRYRQKSKELSALFRLDPVPPLEKAVYYTEQLMKLGNFKHLQPSSVHLSWYQYTLLDVLAVIALVLFVSWKIIRFVCSTCCGFCKSSKSKTD